MILFWSLAAVMLALALLLLLPPLLQRDRAMSSQRQGLNVAIFQQRLQELERDLGAGDVGEAEYQPARAELERDLLADTGDDDDCATLPSRNPISAIALGIAVPLVALGLYVQLGSHQYISGEFPQQEMLSMPSIMEMVENLARRLESEPDDVTGWVMLGRSYLTLERPTEAAEAYARAYALDGEDADIAASYAEALFLAHDANMAGRPLQLVNQALGRNPNHEKALWLAGVAALQQDLPREALSHWRKLAALLPPDGEDARWVLESIASVRAKMGMAPEPEQVTETTPDSPSTGIKVRVQLDAALQVKAGPEDTVFIFARAMQGPPMPLVAARRQVKDLPVTLILDDSLAISPDLALSQARTVLVGARISKSGTARAASGDLQGSVGDVTVGSMEPVVVVIDQEVL